MVATSNLNDPQFDGVLVVTDKISKLSGKLDSLKSALQDYSKVIGDIKNLSFILALFDLCRSGI